MLRRLLYQLIAFVVLLLLALGVFVYLMLRPITCAPVCVGVNLTGRDLRGLDLQGVNFVEANLTGANLQGANLQDADFSGARLSGANLRNSDLSDAKLIGADLTRVYFNDSNLKGADLSGANLGEADLTGVDLTETVVNGVSFPKARLTDAKLRNAYLSGVKFNEANLSGADLTGANVSGASFSRADASGALFAESLMVGAWLNLTNLTGADLTGANLLGSQIVGGQLTSANLTNANLQGSIAIGANLNGANLRGANLQQMQVLTDQVAANLLTLDPTLAELNELQRKVILVPANLNGVQSDQQTRWPAVLTTPAAISTATATTPTLSQVAGLTLTNPLTGTEQQATTAALPVAKAPTVTATQPATTTTLSLVEPVSVALPTLDSAITITDLLGGSQARRVKLNFYLNTLDHINEMAGTFDAELYVDFFWQDDSLAAAGATAPFGPVGSAQNAAFFDPKFEVVNTRHVWLRYSGYIPSTELGYHVQLRSWLRGTFANPFDLRQFPFDRQHLVLKFESAEFDSEQLLFDFAGFLNAPPPSEERFIQAVAKGRYLTRDALPPAWQVEDLQVAQQVRVLAYDNSSWSQVNVDLTVQRVDAPYIRRLLLAVGFLWVLAWGVFWIESQALHFRLWLLGLLFVVANVFNIILWQTLPKLPYVTFLDSYLLACYSALAILALFSMGIYAMAQGGYQQASRWLNRGLAVGYPILAVIVNFLLLRSVLIK